MNTFQGIDKWNQVQYAIETKQTYVLYAESALDYERAFEVTYLYRGTAKESTLKVLRGST